MLKITYIIRRAEGGMAQHLADLIKGLNRSVYEPVLIAPPGHKMGEGLEGAGVPIHEVNFPDRPNPLTDFKAALRIARLYREIQPDIIHIHGHKAAAVGVTARLLAGRKTPVIISVHNYPSYQAAGFTKRKLGSLIQRFIAARAAVLIAVSEDIRQNMIKNEGLNPDKIVTVHNGFDLNEIREPPKAEVIAEAKRLQGIGPEEKVIGAIGRLVAFKGFSVLLDATALLKQKRAGFKTFIAGRGPEEDNLKTQVEELGIQDVIVMPGFLPDLAPYFAMADVFVVPSTMEPFGLIVLQAMAAGRPVIGAKAGGIPEIISDGATGVLVPPNDPQALADAIDSLLDDESRRQRLAEAALGALKKRFSLESMVDQTVALYKECLKAK